MPVPYIAHEEDAKLVSQCLNFFPDTGWQVPHLLLLFDHRNELLILCGHHREGSFGFGFPQDCCISPLQQNTQVPPEEETNKISSAT